ncbi:MAG: LysM peptidoglycan-binding domain-containing protein [Flavobacteriales bacterium]
MIIPIHVSLVRRVRHLVSLFALAGLLVTLTGCASIAQISAPVEVQDGKSYYMHTVKKGETTYAISKAYGCDINDLLSSNPGTDAGIKEGQVLRIPVEKAKAKVTVFVPDASGFINHEVQKRETLFGIARMYNVDVNDIAEANPGVDKGVKKGQILRIPVKGQPQVAPEPVQGNKKHIVAQGETLFGISRQYSVPVDAITAANPGVETAGLKPGQVLNIPVRALPLEPGPDDQTPLNPEKPFGPVAISGGVKESYKIGLILPFMTSPVDTVGLTPRERRLQTVAFQMFRGAMIATDTLKAQGLNADVYSYDLADSKSAAATLCKLEEMKDMDVLIGPAFRDPLAEVARWAGETGTHVVCPVPQANKVLLNALNMSKAYPSELTMWEGLGRFISKRHRSDNVILCTTNEVEDLKRIQAFRGAYYRERGDSVSEFEIKNRSIAGITKRLKPAGTNVVVVPSADRLLLTTMFKELGSNNTVVYGTEEWEEINLIEPAARNTYEVRFPKAIFIDYNDPAVQSFVEAYRKRFRTEPDEYAFLGYSSMLYYGKGLQLFGRQFPNHFGEWKCEQCISAGFDFARTGEDAGFENRYFAVVGTQDFQLIQLNK